jgi:hypothetical protein
LLLGKVHAQTRESASIARITFEHRLPNFHGVFEFALLLEGDSLSGRRVRRLGESEGRTEGKRGNEKQSEGLMEPGLSGWE